MKKEEPEKRLELIALLMLEKAIADSKQEVIKYAG